MLKSIALALMVATGAQANLTPTPRQAGAVSVVPAPKPSGKPYWIRPYGRGTLDSNGVKCQPFGKSIICK